MSAFTTEQLRIIPGMADLIDSFDNGEPPEWLNLPAFLFFFRLQQYDDNRRYSKDDIGFGQLQETMGQLYQSGCILGHRLKPKRGVELMKLAAGRVQKDADQVFASSKRKARQRVDRYRRAMGRLPVSIPELRILTGYLDEGLHPVRDVARVRLAARQRVSLNEAKKAASIAFNEGIALSITQPTLWKKAMAAHDSALPELSANSGVPLPDMAFLFAMVRDLSQTWADMSGSDLLRLLPESE